MRDAAFRLAGWCIESQRGLRLVRCERMSQVARVAHAFSTRQATDGVDFDCGSHEQLGEPHVSRRTELCEAAGLAGREPTILHQVHGSRIVDWEEVGRPGQTRADGVVAWQGEGRAVAAVRTADCVPILLAQRDGSAVAAVHAGWRGTAARVAVRAVDRMVARGVMASALVAAVGPAIGVCCYEVGSEVRRAVARASGVPVRTVSPDGRSVDLKLANRLQLESAGLPASSIGVAPWCTACSCELFFSHRVEGSRAGRSIACIGWKALSASAAGHA